MTLLDSTNAMNIITGMQVHYILRYSCGLSYCH